VTGPFIAPVLSPVLGRSSFGSLQPYSCNDHCMRSLRLALSQSLISRVIARAYCDALISTIKTELCQVNLPFALVASERDTSSGHAQLCTIRIYFACIDAIFSNVFRLYWKRRNNFL
jgi:hypothetical protein